MLDKSLGSVIIISEASNGCLIDWKGKIGTKCLKEKFRCIKNYGSLHSFKRKFRIEEFPHQASSADVR